MMDMRMKNETEVRLAVREWLTKNASKRKRGTAPSPELTDETLIIDQGVVSSLKLMQLVVFIGELRGSPVEMDGVAPAQLASVNAIWTHFFAGHVDGA
jgi:hypothetical protein